MPRLATLVLACIALAQESSESPPLLRVGDEIEGEIGDADTVVHTPALDKGFGDAPVLGKSYRIEVEESGSYTIELRSYFFDAYLVLHDEEGKLVSEDDDGLLATHSRIVGEFAPGSYRVFACALHGQRGEFELMLQAGRPRDLAPRERAAARREDLERQVALVEKVRGPEHPDTATSLNTLAISLWEQGDYAAARPVYERALAIREKALGPEHSDTAQVLNNLARLLNDQGDYAAARPLYERALAIREKVLGPEHPGTATCLNNLARLLNDQGDYAAARPLYERALAIREKVLGPDHPDTATSLNNLAGLLRARGDYAAAGQMYERALAIREKALGPEHPRTATSLNSLAGLLRAQGDHTRARQLYERALAIDEKALGPEHPDTAQVLNNLALLLKGQGDYAAALPYYERALAIREKVLGPEHPGTATSLNNLARLLRDQGDYAAALLNYERALAIREKVLGPEHPDTATSLGNLAVLLVDVHDYTAARPYLERALAIHERTLGPRHRDTATSLANLAQLLWSQGDYAAARPLYERALAISESTLGPEHPETARLRHNLADVLADAGRTSESLELVRQALMSILSHAQSTLWSLSEKERLLFLRRGEHHLRHVLSLAAISEQGTYEALAYDLSLAWRGLVSRTLLESRARLEASLPEGATAVIEMLRDVQSQLSKLLYATEVPDRVRHEREIRALRERRNELEVELQRLIGPTQERSVALAELQAHLEAGSAFLDFMVHPREQHASHDEEQVIRTGGWSADNVSAWIVRPDRKLVHVDLGPAAELERAVTSWLGQVVRDRTIGTGRGISTSESDQAASDGLKLRTLLWRPLTGELDGIQRVFVRADSFLGTLPFEVIPLEDGRFLIEEKTFVYVQTPLDLIGTDALPDGGPPTLLAAGDVDFQSRGEVADDRPKAQPVVASVDIRGARRHGWPALPFTGQEAEAIQKLHEAAFRVAPRLLLEGRLATEERLKDELPRHSVLHLATHGFFHPDGTASAWDSAGQTVAKEEPMGFEHETRALVGALPGLLTGLVCAGANEPAPAGQDDGLLTAEEVLWLDLSKVDLVVLSACETALGERRSGEGMIGLRRAFGLAGARTVVSSLWSVKDRSTSELMQHFYENLWRKKQGRAEALRNAQLEMLARNRASEHDALPSTWGAFVLSGEWR